MSDQSNEFERAGKNVPPNPLVEYWMFLKNNKKWWLLPILLLFLMFGALLIFSGGAAAPFIYTLF